MLANGSLLISSCYFNGLSAEKQRTLQLPLEFLIYLRYHQQELAFVLCKDVVAYYPDDMQEKFPICGQILIYSTQKHKA